MKDKKVSPLRLNYTPFYDFRKWCKRYELWENYDELRIINYFTDAVYFRIRLK